MGSLGASPRGQQFLWEDDDKFINIQVLAVSSEETNREYSKAENESKSKHIGIFNNSAPFKILVLILYLSRLCIHGSTKLV